MQNVNPNVFTSCFLLLREFLVKGSHPKIDCFYKKKKKKLKSWGTMEHKICYQIWPLTSRFILPLDNPFSVRWCSPVILKLSRPAASSLWPMSREKRSPASDISLSNVWMNGNITNSKFFYICHLAKFTTNSYRVHTHLVYITYFMILTWNYINDK